jgi:simple sugar transport system permease protein
VRRVALALIPLYAITLAFGVAALLLLSAGIDPGSALSALFDSALGSKFAVGDTISHATPLLFTALAAAFAFRAGVYNIGAEGQLYIGALAGAFVAINVTGVPSALLITLCFVVSALGGAAWALLAALAKVYRGTNEIMSTLLLNFIGINIVAYFVARGYGPMHGEGVTFAGSDYIQQSAHMPTLIPEAQANAALLIGVAIALVVAFVMARTTLGFQIRASGLNPVAARYAGHAQRSLVVTAMAISGAIAGLAGTAVILSQTFLLGANLSPPPGWGYVGIAVALLGRLRPLPIIAAALFFGALEAGAQGMQLQTSTPASISLIIESTTIIFVMVGGVVSVAITRRMALAKTRNRVRALTEEAAA